MGRPTKITQDKLELIEQLASEGLSLRSIAAKVGISNSKIIEYNQRGENQKGIGLKVWEHIQKGYADLERMLLASIRSAAMGIVLRDKNGNPAPRKPVWQAAARMLEALKVWDNHYSVKVNKFDVPFDEIPEAAQQKLVRDAVKELTGVEIKKKV